MFKNYIKITLRNIRKDKWFSLINIIGLTIGITGSLLIYLHINHELSYDNFHKDVDELYRVVRINHNSTGDEYESNVPYPFINALNDDFDVFENATLTHTESGATLAYNDDKYRINRGIFADSSFFSVFGFEVISGDPKKSLAQPNFIFLTEETATKIFGDEDPIGKKIKLNLKLDLEVVGIVKSPPTNSSIQFDYVVSYPSISTDYIGGLEIDSWGITAQGTAYVKLKNGINADQANDKFKPALEKYLTPEEHKRKEFLLQPLTKVHFETQWNKNAQDTTNLWTIGVIGAFILFIGCVNFINLSTALAVRKSKEIGVRKTLGAGRGQLILQFLGETFFITLLSALLAVGISERLVGIFNKLFDTKLALNVFENGYVLLFLLGIVLVVTALAGIYPSIVLSGFNPIKALKTNIHSQSSGALFLRKGLITIQFLISQVLIIATLVISSQMNFFFNTPLGFDKEAIINIPLGNNDESKLNNFKQRLLQNPAIDHVSFNMAAPIGTSNFETSYRLSDQTEDEEMQVKIKPADIDYLNTYGLELLHGRWFTETDEILAKNIFNEDTDEDKKLSYIINETAAKKLGYQNLEEAIGQDITTGIGDISAPIIGIVKDFHTGTFHEKIAPTLLVNFPMFYYNTGVKINFSQSRETIAYMEDMFEQTFPEDLFEYEFLDDSLGDYYANEERAYNLLMVFSGLSIFISCLGLLGVVAFVVNQKTKEVGVRKVLGASVSSIVALFAKDFLILVLIAFLIAAPVAWYFMQSWLGNFAYQIDLTFWFFIIGLLISGIITFITIGFQSMRAAMSNPVKSLKDE